MRTFPAAIVTLWRLRRVLIISMRFCGNYFIFNSFIPLLVLCLKIYLEWKTNESEWKGIVYLSRPTYGVKTGIPTHYHIHMCYAMIFRRTANINLHPTPGAVGTRGASSSNMRFCLPSSNFWGLVAIRLEQRETPERNEIRPGIMM